MADTGSPALPSLAQQLRQRQAERKARLLEEQATKRHQSGISPTPTATPSLPGSPTVSSPVPPQIPVPGSVSLPVNPPPPISPSKRAPPPPPPPPPPELTAPPQSEPSSSGSPPAQGRLLSSQVTVSDTSVFGPPALGPNEYALGLPLNTEEIIPGGHSQQSLHLSAINKHYAAIERFLTAAKAANNSEAFDVMKQVGAITVHPNLVHALPTVDATDEEWMALHSRSSAKFKFLRDVVALLKEKYVKIGIIAQETATIDMLERLFRGMKVYSARFDKPSVLPELNDIESEVSVFIVPSKDSGAVGSSCNIVFAIDSFFDADEPEVKQMRADILDPHKTAPVVRLLTLNTIEHALLCADSEKDFFLPCIEAIKLLRNDAGKADPAYMSATQDAARTMAAWIGDKCQGELNIPPLPELSLFEPLAATVQVPATMPPASPDNGEKRKRRESLAHPPIADPKKLRLSPSADDGDIAQITPTLLSPTHTPAPPSKPPLSPPNLLSSPTDHRTTPPPTIPIPTSIPSPPPPRDPSVAMSLDSSPTDSDPDLPIPGAQRSPQSPRSPHLIARPIDLPPPETLESLDRETLIARMQSTTEQLNSYISSTSRLTTRHELLRASVSSYRHQLSATTAELATNRTQLLRTEASNAALSSRLGAVAAQLEEARQALRAGGVPLARMAEITGENEGLRKELEGMRARVEQLEQDLVFTREQYTAASNATVAVRGECEELQRENEGLRRRADERRVELHKIWKDGERVMWEEERGELLRRVKEMEGRCGRLEEEKKGRERGAGRRMRSARNSPVVSRASSPASRW